MYAQSFDINELALTGSPFLVADEAVTNPSISYAPLSASLSGSFVYSAGTNRHTQFIWFERAGTVLTNVGEPDSRPVLNISLSPDGRSIAMGRNIGGNWDIWLFDTLRGVLDRIPLGPAIELSPVWSPDGARVAFSSRRPDMPGIYEKIASGPGGDELMLGSDAALSPSDWSRDGRFVLYHGRSPTTGSDLWALPLDGDREPFPVVQTKFDEGVGQFSPDGRWIAYQSNESGRVEIYLSPFPGPGRQWRISTAGGSLARWRPDGEVPSISV